MPADLPPFDPVTTKPNSTINEPERSPMLPTWDPDAPSKDADLVRITAANPNGEYGVLDGSNPAQLEDHAPGAFLDSDALQGGATRAATGLNSDEQRR